jgi:N-acyl-D-aspartate/D-glutamate deacylase
MDSARFPLGDPPDYEPGPEKSVRAIAARENRAPKEVAYDLLLEKNGQGLMPGFEINAARFR